MVVQCTMHNVYSAHVHHCVYLLVFRRKNLRKKKKVLLQAEEAARGKLEAKLPGQVITFLKILF